jgi:hypothetical protein
MTVCSFSRIHMINVTHTNFNRWTKKETVIGRSSALRSAKPHGTHPRPNMNLRTGKKGRFTPLPPVGRAINPQSPFFREPCLPPVPRHLLRHRVSEGLAFIPGR